jgi:hypothetical protein
MRIQQITRNLEGLHSNWNQVSDPHLVDYFIYQIAAQEALLRHTILQGKRAVGLPVGVRKKPLLS